MYAVIRWVIVVLMHALTRVHVDASEAVPMEGPLIMAANHLSRVDPPLIAVGFPRRLLVFAARKYRTNPFLFLLFELVGCIWVRQSDADLDALKAAVKFLRSGGALGVAPEGTRSQNTNALIKAKSGVAYLASRSGARVVPVAVWGTENAIPSLRRLKRADVWLKVGKPLDLKLPPRAKVEELDAATGEIMGAIAALLPAAYRGEYADHPRCRTGAST